MADNIGSPGRKAAQALVDAITAYTGQAPTPEQVGRAIQKGLPEGHKYSQSGLKNMLKWVTGLKGSSQ
jgi:hypothetical protein